MKKQKQRLYFFFNFSIVSVSCCIGDLLIRHKKKQNYFPILLPTVFQRDKQNIYLIELVPLIFISSLLFIIFMPAVYFTSSYIYNLNFAELIFLCLFSIRFILK